MKRSACWVNLNPRKQATVAEVSFEDKDTIVYLRSVIEPYAARLSVEKIPQQRIDEVRMTLQKVMADPYDTQSYVTSDLALHELLHQYAGSRILSEVISSVKEHSIRLRYSAERFGSDDIEEQASITKISTQEHLEILDAIEKRDGELAYQRVHDHIYNFAHRLDYLPHE
ncbi:MAG: FCD domain-containing protein [Oscillospiraceae bacterium]